MRTHQEGPAVDGVIHHVCECGHTFPAPEGDPAHPPRCPRCQRPLTTALPKATGSGEETSDVPTERILLEKGWITQDQLRAALARVEEERGKGRQLPLDRALVEAGAVTTDRIRQALSLQGKVPMRCDVCRRSYRVKGQGRDRVALCPTCHAPLIVSTSPSATAEDSRAVLLRQTPPGEAANPMLEDLIPGYRIERRVGTGEMGDVYLAWQISLDRPVAIRILPPELSGDREYTGRFLAEARSASTLIHENLVAALDAGESRNRLYLVMEYANGNTLQDLIRREGPIPEERAIEIAGQVARGLHTAYAHGLVHRAITPANIMISPSGTAKICDFGLARKAQPAPETSKESGARPTTAYASPEQCRGEAPSDPRADMYSLGATLFEMLVGQPPFKANTPPELRLKILREPPLSPRSLNPAISQGVDLLVMRLLRKQPEKRYRNYEDLIRAMDAIREPNRQPKSRLPADRPRPRGIPAIVGVVAGALLLAAVLILFIVAKSTAPSQESLHPEAAALLETARKFEEQARGKPDLYPGILERWKELERRYRGTTAHPAFVTRRMEFENKVASEAESAAQGLLAESDRLVGIDRIPEAIEILGTLSPGFRDTRAGRRVVAKAREIEALLGERTRKGWEACLRLIAAGDFDGARDATEKLKAQVTFQGTDGTIRYASPHHEKEIGDLKRRIEEESQAASRRREEEQARKSAPSGAAGPAKAPVPPADPSPQESKPAPPAVPSPPSFPGTNPPRPSVVPPPAPAKLPEPDAAVQKEKEREIRDIFKDEYARKAAADRKALARKLMDLARESADDTAARFVLYREAQAQAIQAGDYVLAGKALDELLRCYDVDAMGMRSSLLLASARGAKTPEELKSVAAAILHAVEESLSKGILDHAEKLIPEAAALARRAREIPLVIRADSLSREVSELRSKEAKAQKALKTLEQNPEHASANLDLGQFLCMVKGQWESGLPHLAKGSDAGLKALAARDLAAPASPAEQLAVADEWWGVAENLEGLSQTNARRRAAHWYEQALPGLSGLHRRKVEQRMAQVSLKPRGRPAVDLLGKVDPAIDGVRGPWRREGQGLLSPVGLTHALIQIPYIPPEEYDLRIEAERVGGTGSLDIGLCTPWAQFLMVLDGYTGPTSGLANLDGHEAPANETAVVGRILSDGRPNTIVCSVRTGNVSVTVNDRRILNWNGKLQRLTLPGSYAPTNRKVLFLGTYVSAYRITSLELVPVSGEGKFTR